MPYSRHDASPGLFQGASHVNASHGVFNRIGRDQYNSYHNYSYNNAMIGLIWWKDQRTTFLVHGIVVTVIMIAIVLIPANPIENSVTSIDMGRHLEIIQDLHRVSNMA